MIWETWWEFQHSHIWLQHTSGKFFSHTAIKLRDGHKGELSIHYLHSPSVLRHGNHQWLAIENSNEIGQRKPISILLRFPWMYTCAWEVVPHPWWVLPCLPVICVGWERWGYVGCGVWSANSQSCWECPLTSARSQPALPHCGACKGRNSMTGIPRITTIPHW